MFHVNRFSPTNSGVGVFNYIGHMTDRQTDRQTGVTHYIHFPNSNDSKRQTSKFKFYTKYLLRIMTQIPVILRNVFGVTCVKEIHSY